MLNQVNWIDIIILIILIRMAFVGLTQGLTKYFLNFIGIVATVCATIHYYYYGAVFLNKNVGFLTLSSAALISFVFIIVGAVLILKISGSFLSKLITIEFASFLEKAGGMIVGIVCGLLFSSLLLITFNFSQAEYIHNSLEKSYSAPLISRMAPACYDVVFKIFPLNPSQGREYVGINPASK
ncbi:MAG: CvpA family protein [Candidatus Omnitrophota bacterium]